MSHRSKLICIMMTAVVAFTQVTAFADVTQEQIDEAKEEIEGLESQLDDVNSTIASLAEQKKKIQSNMDSYTARIDSLGNDIADTLDAIESTEAAIADLRRDIEELETELDGVQLLSDTQYEAMKKRIAYMYENDAGDVLMALLEAGSISDMLSRAAYVQSINDYDRTALKDYAATMDQLNAIKDDVEASKAQMEDTQAALEAKRAELESEKGRFGSLLSGSRSDMDDTNNDINAAELTAEELEEQIKKMKAYEAQLEIQKAKEDLARLAELQEWENEAWDDGPYSAGDDELSLFAALIQCEAWGEGTVGQMAVASVVMNRVASSRFPGSVYGVILQSGQFSPVASGRVSTVLSQGPVEACYKVAERALSGERTTSALFFRTVASAKAAGFDFKTGVIIGNHYFYPVKDSERSSSDDDEDDDDDEEEEKSSKPDSNKKAEDDEDDEEDEDYEDDD